MSHQTISNIHWSIFSIAFSVHIAPGSPPWVLSVSLLTEYSHQLVLNSMAKVNTGHWALAGKRVILPARMQPAFQLLIPSHVQFSIVTGPQMLRLSSKKVEFTFNSGYSSHSSLVKWSNLEWSQGENFTPFFPLAFRVLSGLQNTRHIPAK